MEERFYSQDGVLIDENGNEIIAIPCDDYNQFCMMSQKEREAYLEEIDIAPGDYDLIKNAIIEDEITGERFFVFPKEYFESLIDKLNCREKNEKSSRKIRIIVVILGIIIATAAFAATHKNAKDFENGHVASGHAVNNDNSDYYKGFSLK